MSYVELLWEYQRLRELYLEYPRDKVLKDLCAAEDAIKHIEKSIHNHRYKCLYFIEPNDINLN